MSFLFAIFLCECIVSLASLSLFYLIPITPVLLTAYACNQLASLEFMIAAILSTGDKGCKPQNLALPLLSLKFLAISFVFSAATVTVEFLNVLETPWVLIIVLNILLQGYYLVKAIIFSSGAAYVSRVEKKASKQLIKFDLFLAEAKQCVALASNSEQKKLLKKMCDAIQYSDPVSRSEIAEYDIKIKTLLDTLKEKISTNDDNVDGICHDLLQSIQTRNENLRILKMEER